MFSWIIGGTIYSLDDKTNFYVRGHTGTGMMPVSRLEERGPLQIGVTDRGYILSERTIVLSMGIRGADLDDLYSKRTTLLNILKPRNTAGKLRWTQGSTVRQIDAHYAGDSLGFEDVARSYLWQRVGVALKCPDPRWYDPALKTTTFNLGGGDDTFEVPFEVPFKVGASTIDQTNTVTYNGSIKAFPTIRITGPITDPVITHNQTGFKLDFTGVTIAAADYYEINLGYSQNTVTDKAGSNVINDLTTDSDLVEFAIEPDPNVAGGVNSINVTGSSVSAASEAMINYYEYYSGI